MNEVLKKQFLASSSGWVSALLNFFPGLGVGYIYQRRWKAYWATTLVSSLWLILDFYNQVSIDSSDPLQVNNNFAGFLGLFAIASLTSLEAWYAVKTAREESS
mgnify:CR=1 FL=1